MATATTKRERPLLFGSSQEDETSRFLDRPTYEAAVADLNWIPGYSEQVRARDLAKAEYGSQAWRQREQLLRDMGIAEVKPPTVEFKWSRVAGLDGVENDNVRIDLGSYFRDGYRFAKADDLKSLGYGVPPAAHIAADGTIRRGDIALMVVDAARAAENAIQRARQIAELEGTTYGADTGTEITVQRLASERLSELPSR